MRSLRENLPSNTSQRALFSAVGARLIAVFLVSHWAHESWVCSRWCTWRTSFWETQLLIYEMNWIRKCKHCHCQGCHTHTHVQLVYVFLTYSNMFKLLQLAVSMIAFSCLSISQKQIMGSRAWHGVIWKRKTKLKRKDRKYSPLANSVLLAEEKLRGEH